MKLTLRFHGDRQEVCELAWRWANELKTSLVVERLFPAYEARLVGRDELIGLARCDGSINRISLSPAPVDVDASSPLDYIKLNPNSLSIDLGKQSDEVLRESFLAGVADDLKIANEWKKVRSLATKSMGKGVWVENVMSGARSRVANHYYTGEARRLAESGVILMGATDWIVYHLD